MTNIAPTPTPALRRRLLQRVQRSREHESQFQTVRREGGGWLDEAAGVRRKPLARTEVARSSLIELDPGAWLPATPGFSQTEFVLLDGAALLGKVALACGDAACAPQDDRHGVQAGPAGARLYVRLSASGRPPADVTHLSALDGDAGWQDFSPGVRIKALWDGGMRRSLLVRMDPGAAVSAHAHALEEECLMLAGEAFIGDTLLRSGDYQLAPQGSRHGSVTTDVGALFYVHGALDPAAYA
jgi:quercetin dioxygenase-like cupin family protein